jgi:hypothetical protein
MNIVKKSYEFAISLNGIGRPECQLWLPVVKNLIKDRSCILLFDPSYTSHADELILTELSVSAESEILNPAELSLCDLSVETIIFTNTPDRLKITYKIPEKLTKACFFGGLGHLDLPLQISKAKELNIDKLISDFLPEEIHTLNSIEFEYFVNRYLFLPPFIHELPLLSEKTEEQVLFIHLGELNTIESSATSTLRKALSKNNIIRVEDLTNVPIDRWLADCTPGPSCRYVTTDVPLPSVHNFIANQCKSRGILFRPLSQRGATSPRRAFLDGNSNLSNWLNLIAPSQKPSLREKCANLLRPEKSREVATPINTENTLKFIQDQLTIGLSSKEKNSFANQHDKNLNILNNNNDSELSYIANPIQFLCKSEPSSQNLLCTFNYLKNINLESLPKESSSITKTFFRACIRLSAQLPPGRLISVHVFRQLASISIYEFIESFCSVFLEKPHSKTYHRLASYVLVLTQTSPLKETIRQQLLQLIAQINLPPDLACIAHLATKNLEFFHQSLIASNNNGGKGTAGNSVYWYLRQNPTPKADELKKLEKYCQEEIKIGQDSMMTHRSLALIQILNGTGNGITEILLNSKKSGPTNWPNQIARHELALSCLVAGEEEEAMLFLNTPANSRKRDPYDNVVRISTALLSDNVPSAEKLASEMSFIGKDKLWEQDELYFCALHHCVIFRHCGLKEAEEKTINWMKSSWNSVDTRYGILLKNITPVQNPTGSILKVAQILSKQIPKFASEMVKT